MRFACSCSSCDYIEMYRTKNGVNGHIQRKELSYDELNAIAQGLLNRTKHRPKVGIICGSGLGGLAELLTDADTFSYKSIPNFPLSTVPGHAGKLVLGNLGGSSVVAMKGRFHMYEGYPGWKVALPVRVMRLMGVETLIVTNAAGGINPEYQAGDVMIIKDHIFFPSLGSTNPLVGQNEDRFGPRFPPLSDAYDKDLRQIAWQVAKDVGLEDVTREGVYVMQGGPAFETVAEARFLRLFGADATGMSTCPEVVVARHCGMKVFGLSLITNKVIMDYETDEKASHDEVLETSRQRANDIEQFITNLVKNISPTESIFQ